jgi:DNA-binding transcriptional ArsR family regulator
MAGPRPRADPNREQIDFAEHALTRIFPARHIQGVNETFAVLGEPNRYRIVELLRSGPRVVNEIGEKLQLNQPQVSKHLKLLKDAGFVQVEARAQQRLYALRPEPLREIQNWLERYRQLWDARFEALDELIEEMKVEKGHAGRKKRK